MSQLEPIKSIKFIKSVADRAIAKGHGAHDWASRYEAVTKQR